MYFDPLVSSSQVLRTCNRNVNGDWIVDLKQRMKLDNLKISSKLYFVLINRTQYLKSLLLSCQTLRCYSYLYWHILQVLNQKCSDQKKITRFIEANSNKSLIILFWNHKVLSKIKEAQHKYFPPLR